MASWGARWPHGLHGGLMAALGGLTGHSEALCDLMATPCALGWHSEASRRHTAVSWIARWPHGAHGGLTECTDASWVARRPHGFTTASRVAQRPHGLHGGLTAALGGLTAALGGLTAALGGLGGLGGLMAASWRPHGGLMAASWRHWAASWRPRRPHGGNRRPHDGTGRPHGGNRRPHDGTGRPHDGTGRPHGGNRRSHGGPRGRTAYTAISIWRSIPSMLCCAVLCCTVRSSAPPIDPRQGRVGDKGISKKVTVAPDEVRTRDLHLTKVSLCH